MTYDAWIEAYKAKHKSVRGLCQNATKAMVEAFPELQRVRGHVVGLGAHWWCVTPDGSIIDPTVCQFPFVPASSSYEPFDESLAHTLPTGKCQNCGGYLYYQAQACDEACMQEILTALGQAWRPGTYRYNPADRPKYYDGWQ